jgi:glycosyltransferase involved in cell wall biosynthesis
MKIAILLNLSDETSGGSYQFNKIIYTSLIESRHDIRHQLFFVFESYNQLGAIPDLSLPSKFKHRLYFLITFIKELYFGIKRREKISLESCRSAWLSQKLLANEVKAVWAVNPLNTPLNFPYLTTSWDIAHKITPYFPELVATKNQLVRRDKICESVFARAFKIIVGTVHGKNEISISYGIPYERILVQPLPIPSITLNQKISRNKYQFIYPANFWSHKNHLVIINALRELISVRNIPIKFVFTGSDKGNLIYVKELIEKFELSNYIDIKGFVSTFELHKLYRSSNACVFPSLIGPDNLPPLEALAAGCKAIVADIPGAREQFSEFVTYFDPYEPESLTKLIEKAILEFDEGYLASDELLCFLDSRSSEIYVKSILKEFDKLEVVVNLTK